MLDDSTIDHLKAVLPGFDQLSQLTKKTANEVAGPCPLCGGRDRFYVHDGRAFCRQCKPKGGDLIDWHQWIEGTDLAGLLKKYGLAGNGSSKTKPKLAKVYDYLNAAGELVHQTLRYEPGRDGRPKSFSQRRPDGKGGWIWSLKGVAPVLYRLQDVIKADEVLVCEGEKDADTLAALGYAATTCPMGAGKWRGHHSEHLKDKRVFILPDNDDAGRKHLAQVARALAGAGIEARVVHLPESVKDVTDFVETFTDKTEAAERLAVMVDGAAPWKPTPDADEKKGPHLIIDECHRAPSRTFTEAVSAFDCVYMLGLSATPWRRDGLSRLIFWHLGDTRHSVDAARLVDEGAMVRAEVVSRETDFRTELDPSAEYNKMLSELAEDEARNRLIAADIVLEASNGGGICLCLSDRKQHCLALQRILTQDFGQPCEVLTGDLPATQRQSLVERLNEGKIKVLIATGQLIGEGFDCRELSTLFLATPIRFDGRVLQYLGRVLRPAPGKDKARVYDYMDKHVGPLVGSFKARQRVYCRG